MSMEQFLNRARETAKRRAIQRWAEVAASEHHDLEIVIPSQFDREEALHALEIAVVRRYSLAPIIELGQGRIPGEIPRHDASLLLAVSLGVAIGLVALGGLIWCLA